jgi:YD repeat-containing protein
VTVFQRREGDLQFKGDGENLVLTAKVRDSQGVPLASQLSIAIGAAYSDWEETPPLTFEVPGDSHTTPSNFSLAEFSAFIESEVDADGWLDDLELNMLSYAGHRDTAGRMKRMTSPIGAQVYYERDRLGRVVGIEDLKGRKSA